MRMVSLKSLKKKLSEYIRLAGGGETFLVTDRGQVIAELVPPQARNSGLASAKLADLLRKGALRPPALPFGPLPPRKPVMSFEELMKDIERDREDG